MGTRPPVAGAPTAVTAFVDVTVVPMDTERVLPNQTVIIQHGWITTIGPSSQVQVPASARRIDGRGKYLIPGLADMHAHIQLERETSQDSITTERRLFLWLANGLTTVRILDHTDQATDLMRLRLRARAAMGQLWSPRLYVAGYLGGHGVASRAASDPYQTLRQLLKVSGTPLRLDEVAEVVTAYKEAGYDFIKVHNVYNHSQVFDSLAATARRVGLPLVGHAVVKLERALQEYRSIEHLTGYFNGAWGEPGELRPWDSTTISAARIRALAVATQRAGVWNCPALYNTISNGDSEQELALHRQLIKALQDAGAGILLGSDRLQMAKRSTTGTDDRGPKLGDIYGDPGATHHELEALVEAGLTPYQALVTGTRNVAVYFGTLGETGTVAINKRADLVLLRGNPLENVRNTQQLAGVMMGGRWLAREEIDQRVATLKTASP